MDSCIIRKKLEDARTLDIQLSAQMLELERLESIAERVTPALSGMPSGSNRTGSALEAAVIQIGVLKDEIKESVAKLLFAKREARAMIDSVTDGALRAVLRCRFLDAMTWDTIAGEVGYSERWCRDMADAGVLWIEKNFK